MKWLTSLFSSASGLQKATSYLGVVAIILAILWGTAKYHEDITILNDQLYLAGKATGHISISHKPKKKLLDTLLGKKVLHAVPGVDPHKIDRIVYIELPPCVPVSSEVVTSSGITLTALRDGTVVSDDPRVKDITVETYTDQLISTQFMVRLAFLYLPKNSTQATNDALIGAHLSYLKLGRLYPDLTFATNLTTTYIGAGLSYKLLKSKDTFLSNTYVGVGYGHDFQRSERRVNFNASVKL